ncbi:MAG: tetratricopeptide repeat protein, partial [Planctomycetes bacterium]|nr:tetratricopeptide repeat protein [Planctomycetota bacterium]
GDLRAFLGHRPVGVRPLGFAGRAWRSVRRRPARSIATFASVAALVSVPMWFELSAISARREKAELLASLPALHTFESYPEKRAEVGVAERAQQFAALDRILELDPNDHATRVARMATFQDVGDHASAARDAAELESRASSRYLVALAARYRASRSDAFGVTAIDLEGMPEPETDVDRFVAAFHEIRMRKGYRSYQHALELLDQAQSYLPARDLRLIALLSVGDFQAAHDAAWQLEGVYGHPTARTRHVIGASCCYQGRYSDAIEPLQQSLQLRPGRHGPMHNLGVAYKNLGMLDEAERCLRQAHAVRPWIWNTLHEMSQIMIERRRFAEALEYAERIPREGTLREGVYRPRAIAQVLFHWALEDYWTQQDVAIEHARRAVESYDELLAQDLRQRERSSALRERALIATLVEGDESKLLDRYLEIASFDPLNPLLLRSLARFLPTTPDRLRSEQLDVIRALFEQQSQRLDHRDG